MYTTLMRSVGQTRYQELVEQHRQQFISQADFTQIAARGFNAVRLPIPWYCFGEIGPEPGPYLGCINYVDKAFDWAEEVGLGLLPVIAVSPGAPAEQTALVRDQGDFKAYREDLLDVLTALCKRYATRISFLGIEVADDPIAQVRRGLVLTDGVPLHSLRNYYRDAYEIVRDCAGDEALEALYFEASDAREGRTEETLRRFIREYVEANGLNVTAYQDPGWPPVSLTEGAAE